MSAPTTTLDPIKHANEWNNFILAGLLSPGTIVRGGVRGFKRETGWDIKKGKGTVGATMTLKTMPPAEGSFTIQLLTPVDFFNWDIFVSEVLSIAPAKQRSQGLAIAYPGFSSIGLTLVVIKDYTIPENQGKGHWTTTIQMIEWQQPPPVNAVSTVNKTKPDVAEDQIPPVDPRIAALQSQIDLANKAAGT